jgi:diaminopimelate epimerase
MRFVKMQGTGNDFLLLEAQGDDHDWPALARAMCHRHLGVGADGLLLVMPSQKAQVRMRIFNPDGSEAEMCGNGVRCLARYALDRGLAQLQDGAIVVETMAGLVTVWPTGEGMRVGMGIPRLRPEEVPVAVEMDPPLLDVLLAAAGRQLHLACLSMGNPHAVLLVEEPVEDFPLAEVGPQVEHHPLFPQRVNLEVARVRDRHHMDVRVWERGVGETLSCGTGATAAVVAAHLRGLVDHKVEVRLPGGLLWVEWDGRGEAYLAGQVDYICEGYWLGSSFPKAGGRR